MRKLPLLLVQFDQSSTHLKFHTDVGENCAVAALLRKAEELNRVEFPSYSVHESITLW
jgi:hypothetical protein